MTAKDSADKLLGDIAAAGGTAATNIANFLLDGCGLTRAGADMQRFGNFGDGAGPLYDSNSGPVSSGGAAYAGGASKQSRLPKEDGIKLQKKKAVNPPFLGRINAPRLPNGRYQ